MAAHGLPLNDLDLFKIDFMIGFGLVFSDRFRCIQISLVLSNYNIVVLVLDHSTLQGVDIVQCFSSRLVFGINYKWLPKDCCSMTLISDKSIL